MAMVANAMASSIISEVQGSTDPVDANNKFYKDNTYYTINISCYNMV